MQAAVGKTKPSRQGQAYVCGKTIAWSWSSACDEKF